MAPSAAADPESALCQAFVRLKGLAVFGLGTGMAFAVLRNPLPLPWSALFSLALAALPTYAITRRQLKNCADMWDLQTPPQREPKGWRKATTTPTSTQKLERSFRVSSQGSNGQNYARRQTWGPLSTK